MICPFCDGTGWKPVMVNGKRRVTRCDHQRPPELAIVPDYKSAAAGETGFTFPKVTD